MQNKKKCCLLSFDYLDYDVFLNVRAFYRLAGYEFSKANDLSFFQLIVILRGLPPRIYNEFKGTIHFYDYVQEHSYDLQTFFPNASEVYHIAIKPKVLSPNKSKYIYGYLPVIPSLWRFSLPFSAKKSQPVHISNFKPLTKDLFQEQLISLVRQKKIKVYGLKWDRVQINAKPLSYLSANLKLATFFVCYGLMYPYQRGNSLSGRMWQAPIQGCLVISEEGTNIFGCPGIIEVSSYINASIKANINRNSISSLASKFWWEKTLALAEDLNLSFNLSQMNEEVILARISLVKQHINFSWEFYLVSRFRLALCRARSLCSKLKRKLRS